MKGGYAMENYDHIPLEIQKYTESWYSFPQVFTVPKGWLYRTDADRSFQYAAMEETISLYCAGDWLEILNTEEPRRIRYEIC